MAERFFINGSKTDKNYFVQTTLKGGLKQLLARRQGESVSMRRGGLFPCRNVAKALLNVPLLML